MPSPKQMEKLAAAAAVRGNVPPVRTPGPGDEMPPEYWQAVLNDAAGDRGSPWPVPPSGRSGCPIFSGTCCGSPAAAAGGPSRSRRPMPSGWPGPTRSGRTSGSGLLDDTCQQRTGRHEEDGCWPSFE